MARFAKSTRAPIGVALLLILLAGCADAPVTPPPRVKAEAAPVVPALAAEPVAVAVPLAPLVEIAPTPVAAEPAAAAVPPPPPALPAAPPPPIMPFDEAVQFAASALFSKAALAPARTADPAARIPLVIDPLVDGNTGYRSVATQTMGERISQLVRQEYPKYDVQAFTTAALAHGPMLFIGTFTAVDRNGKAAESRDYFRICLALVDLRTGTIASKGFARARLDGVDTTPTAFFADSPAWAPDGATQGYVKTCQGTKAGDPINPVYWDRIVAAAMINDATLAYEAKRYEDAFDLFKGVLRVPGGDQLRVYDGIYLASEKLGRKEEAQRAFGQLIDYGLAQKQLGVKFLFRPGSTLFIADPGVSTAFPTWLAILSQRAASRSECLDIVGHTSRTGPEPLNERLSLMRAQYIKQRVDGGTPQLSARTAAWGKGSSENISGLGTDDARDAIDRRVEFKVRDCVAS